MRKYKCYDRKPIETRNDIIKWDIKDGLPKDLPTNIKLVFLDPPYWKQAEGKYSNDKEDLANMSLDKFYDSLVTFVTSIKKKLADDGKIALVIQGTQWKSKDHKLVDHATDLIELIKKKGFEVEQRFILPYSTEQYNAQMVTKAKEEKICLTIYRDLVVFKRKINE